MPKILGFCMAHYGAPFFRQALESLYDQVDHIVVLYTDHPSQGYAASIPCPDTEQDLLECARPFMTKNGKPFISWEPGRWAHEGEHCSAISLFAGEYDWLWRFDLDEVCPPGMVAEMIAQAETSNHKVYCVPFVHFWRCFNRVCRDGQMPARLTRVHGGEGERYLDPKGGAWQVFHFGYAQPSRYIAYKLQVSGHHTEFRPDWFQDRWLANAQKDVHPVMFPTHWMTESFDKETLPPILKAHPYFNAEVIE